MKTIRHTATLFYYDGAQVFEARDAIGDYLPPLFQAQIRTGPSFTTILMRDGYPLHEGVDAAY